MKSDTDIVVIGGGIIGASIFHHLARDGHRVILIEKNNIASGCTSASGGLVRCFHLDSTWSNRALYGWHYYHEFQQQTGIPINITPSGFVYIPADRNKQIAQSKVEELSKHIALEWLNKQELENRFSKFFSCIPNHAVFEPGAVYASPKEVTFAWINAGKSLNGIVYENTDVIEIKIDDNLVRVETSNGFIVTKMIVIAAGANTPQLLNQLGYSHRLYKKNIRADLRRPLNFPTSHPAFNEDNIDLYGRPDIASKSFYIGLPTDNYISDQQHTKNIYEHGFNRFNWVKDSVLLDSFYSEDCYSRDGCGAVKAVNSEETIYVASGFSGGGFKIAPWVGNTIAQLINNKRDS